MPIQITKRPFEVSFTGNPIRYELQSQEAADDNTIYFEIGVMFSTDNGNTFSEIASLPFFPFAGVAEINIQDILHSELKYYVPQLPAVDRNPQQADGQTGHYYLRFRQVTSVDPSPDWNESESEFIRVAIKGGINYFKYRAGSFFGPYFRENRPFLTWQQNGRKAALTEKMFLAFYNWAGTSGPDILLTIRCQVFFTDGSNLTLEYSSNFTHSQVYYLPAGAMQHGIVNMYGYENKSIHFWELQIVDVNDPQNPANITEAFRFYSDNRINKNDWVLHYRNSLGGLDSVQVRGVIDTNIEYTYQEAARTSTADYYSGKVVTPQSVITDTLEKVIYKGDVGYLGKEEQDRLRDTSQQREVYIINDLQNSWWPVNIVTKSLKLRSTTDMRFSLPIEFTLGYEGGSYYTPFSILLPDETGVSVCLAYLQNFTATIDFSAANVQPGNCLVTINGSEVDTQGASEFWQWKLGTDQNWHQQLYSELPLSIELPENQLLTFQYRAMCADVPASSRSVLIDTTQPATPPPPPANTGKRVYFNNAKGSSVTVTVNGYSTTIAGYDGANINLNAGDQVTLSTYNKIELIQSMGNPPLVLQTLYGTDFITPDTTNLNYVRLSNS